MNLVVRITKASKRQEDILSSKSSICLKSTASAFLAILFLVCSFSLLLRVEPALATGTPTPPILPDVAKDPSGASTGTLIAAALETVGYKAQSLVLKDLKSMLLGLGTLVYVCCLLSGILTIALLGKYPLGLWFFVGPSMFYFLIENTVKANGAEWQFGAFENQVTAEQESDVDEFLKENVKAEVSWAFHRYNVFISNMVQNLVKLITNADKDRQLKFMVRTKIMSDLFATDIGHPDVVALVKSNYLQCSDAMNSARAVALGHRDPDYRLSQEWAHAAGRYCDLTYAAGKRVPDISKPALHATLSELPADGTDDAKVMNYCVQRVAKETEKAKEMNVRLVDRSDLSCMDLWCFSLLSVHKIAKDAREKSKQMNTDPKHMKEDTMKGLYDDLLVKLGTEKPLKDQHGKTLKTLYRDEAARAKVQHCEKYDNIDTKDFLVENSAMIDMIITGHILRKYMTQDARSEMIGELGEHAGVVLEPYNFNLEMSPDQKNDVVQRQMQHAYSTAQRWEVFTNAMALPYVQGILLYGLAITFPFFALMTLVPGKAGVFFVWCGLWAWVKFWDIGWAVVMVIDDILWSLMPHSGAYDPTRSANHGPITVFEAGFNGDLAYSLATYYTILGILVSGVPYLTAQAVGGAKRAIGGVMIDGVKALGQSFGAGASDKVVVRHVHDMGMLRENFAINHVRKNALGKNPFLLYEEYQKKASADPRNAAKYAAELSDKMNTLANGGTFGTAADANVGALLWGTQGAVGKDGKTTLTSPGALQTYVGGVQLQMHGQGAANVGVGINLIGWGTGAMRFRGPGTVGKAESWANLQGTSSHFGLGMKRKAYAMMAEYNRRNASLHYANLAQQDEWRTAEQLRAGTSGRGEWWVVPEAPYRVNALMDQTMQKLDSEYGAMQVEGRINIASGFTGLIGLNPYNNQK